MDSEEIENYKKAGLIARKTKEYAREIIKPGMLLIDIAEKIEKKIEELGGKPAFPVDLGINDIAAHYSPSAEDKTTASGLLKVDIGIHVKGYIADTAFSLDLENSKENKKLILASEEALKKAASIAKAGTELWKIGETIQKTITSFGLSPIKNLSGHSLDRYDIHSGTTIPNYNNNNIKKLESGVYAIEPFSTSGLGFVYEGKPSGIYRLNQKKPVRSRELRNILSYIEDNYRTLPFCERWLIKIFPHAKISLRLLEKQNILHQYPDLIEKGRGKVSQAEHTLLVTDDKTEILS